MRPIATPFPVETRLGPERDGQELVLNGCRT